MGKAILAAVLAACAMGSWLFADDDVAAKVKALVADLASEDCDTRDKASQALIAIGPPAEGALEACLSSSDAEVRTRARDALSSIRTEKQVGPSAWITLAGKSLPALDAFQDLAKQGNRKLDPGTAALDGVIVPVGSGRVPFWQALDALCDGVGCSYQSSFSDGIVLQHDPLEKVPRCYQGPFRMRATRVDLSRTLTLASGAVEAETDVTLQLQWEPHVKPYSIQTVATIVEATDDKGGSMVPVAKKEEEVRDMQKPEGGPEVPIPTHDFAITLGAPSAGARAIRSLKGTLDVMFLVERAELLFGEKEREHQDTKTTGPVSVKVASWNRDGGQATAKLVITGLNAALAGLGDAPKEGSDPMELLQFFLRDAQGKDRSHGEMTGETTMGDADHAEFDVTFTEVPDGAFQLGVTIVTKTLLRTVTFEFHDIPLP